MNIFFKSIALVVTLMSCSKSEVVVPTDEATNSITSNATTAGLTKTFMGTVYAGTFSSTTNTFMSLGNVTLPSAGTLYLKLEDVSRMDVAAPVISQLTLKNTKKLPTKYVMVLKKGITVYPNFYQIRGHWDVNNDNKINSGDYFLKTSQTLKDTQINNIYLEKI